MGATPEKVWGHVSGRPGHTDGQNQGPPFSECFYRFPGSVCPRLSAPGATQSRLPGALSMCRRLALGELSDPAARVGGTVGTSPRGEGHWAEDTRPSAGGSGRDGARLEEPNRRAAQPFRGAGKQPAIPLRRLEGRGPHWPLYSSPKTEDQGSLGKLPQLHVAGKDVALESDGLGLRNCMTLGKSFNFSEAISQL